MTPVALTIAKFDIDSTYYVMGLKHEWAKGAQGVVTTLNLSKIISDSTPVTPAGVMNEPPEAPQGYDDPGGDGETIEANGNVAQFSLYEEGVRVDTAGITGLDFVGDAVTATLSTTITGAGLITISAAASTMSGALVQNTFNFSSGAGADDLDFSTELIDTGDYWSATNPDRFTMATAGKYLVGLRAAEAKITSTGDHRAYVKVFIRFKNSGGSTVRTHDYVDSLQNVLDGSTTYYYPGGPGGVVLYDASANDYVEAEVDIYTSESITYTINPAEFWIMKVG